MKLKKKWILQFIFICDLKIEDKTSISNSIHDRTSS